MRSEGRKDFLHLFYIEILKEIYKLLWVQWEYSCWAFIIIDKKKFVIIYIKCKKNARIFVSSYGTI